MKVKKFLYIILSVGLIMGLLGACSKKEVASNIDFLIHHKKHPRILMILQLMLQLLLNILRVQ